MSESRPRPEQVMERLLTDYRTASLATVAADGSPQVSYVPTALDEQRRFLFFVSELSEHTANLQRDGRASLMLIEDEGRSEQLFARHRLTVNGRAEPIARDSGQAWAKASAVYGERFGKLFSMLSGLKDFHMFALSPQEIRLVVGFGAAYRISGAEWDRLELQTGK